MNLETLRLGTVLAWIKRTQLKCLLVITLLCLVLRENYPFSHFPMYSSFSRSTYFLYLTDANGAALRTRRFGLTSADLKKIFDSYRRMELKNALRSGSERVPAAERAAGQSLLHYLDRLCATQSPVKNLLHGLRVQHVEIRLEARDLVLETRTLATHE